MVLQNYQNFTEMTSNMIHIVAFGVGLKCQRKIHLNTQWGRGALCVQMDFTWIFQSKPNATITFMFEVISVKFW